MFYYCLSLTSLNLSSFNTSKVTIAEAMKMTASTNYQSKITLKQI